MSKIDFAVFGVIAALGLMALIQYNTLGSTPSGFAVMPILAPVSLDYEQTMRNGKKPLNIGALMQILPELEQSLDHNKVSIVELEQFQQHRSQMLTLRNERHALNIALMDDGIALLQSLNAAQWDWVQSQRDHNQAQMEMDIVEQLMDQLVE